MIYRKRHNEIYPDPDSLTNDMVSNYLSYGFHNSHKAQMSLTNPDTRYMETGFLRKKEARSHIFSIFNTRPNGSYIGTPTPKGKKDLLADCSIYVHTDLRYSKEKRCYIPSGEPYGFFIALWKDGTVTKVPWYDRVFYKLPNGRYALAYADEAGIPSNIITYSKHLQKYKGK